MSPFIVTGIVLSLLSHVLDQGTDIFAVVLFYFEGNIWASVLTLGFVMLPGICIGLAEMKRFCAKDLSLLKAIGYILFSPLWAIVIHLYSLFDHRYIPTALFFKAMQGFLESGPQATLQLSLLFYGSSSRSKQMLIEPHLPSSINQSIFDPINSNDYVTDEVFQNHDLIPTLNETSDTIDIFGRIYDKEDRLWFGWIHTLSVIISFLSVFVTAISFNELEANHHPSVVVLAGDPDGLPGTPVIDDSGNTDLGKCGKCGSRGFAKLCFGIPFLLFTLIYRIVGIALLITFLQVWSGVIIFILFFINVLTALFVGDNFVRATAYGMWSLLVPVGYNRDPAAHFGYKKVAMILEHTYTVNEEELVTEKDITRSRVRSKYFLTMHILTSIFVLGVSLIFMLIIIHSNPVHYYQQTILTPEILSYICVPILGLSLGTSVMLARPYHRCDCSGGEIPAGNIIV